MSLSKFIKSCFTKRSKSNLKTDNASVIHPTSGPPQGSPAKGQEDPHQDPELPSVVPTSNSPPPPQPLPEPRVSTSSPTDGEIGPNEPIPASSQLRFLPEPQFSRPSISSVGASAEGGGSRSSVSSLAEDDGVFERPVGVEKRGMGS